MTASQTFTFVDSQGRKEKGRRRPNPDGSVGGRVAPSAQVHPTAVIHADAIVEPKAVVAENMIIEKGSIVMALPKT